MRIGIDGGCWSNRRGYGRFLHELLKAVARRGSNHEYVVFLDAESYLDFSLEHPFSACEVRTSQSVAVGASSGSRRSTLDLFRMGRSVAQRQLDLFFFPSVYSYFPLLRPLPVVLGIHDTIADRNPAFAFDSRWQEMFWRLKVKLALRQASTVLTVSNYSKRCIGNFLKVPDGQIRVIYEAASPRFRKMDRPGSERPYVLYVGGISPNKNLATLIRAFATCRSRSAGLRMILAGDYDSDGFKSCYHELNSLIENLGLQNAVAFPGYVPDSDLAQLYSNAAMFALPSLDEGFGLPAIEAMACGVPVIVSTGNAMEEVVGNGGLLAHPMDVDTWAGHIDFLFENPAKAHELSANAMARSAEFSWDRAAGELIDVFEETRAGYRSA